MVVTYYSALRIPNDVRMKPARGMRPTEHNASVFLFLLFFFLSFFSSSLASNTTSQRSSMSSKLRACASVPPPVAKIFDVGDIFGSDGKPDTEALMAHFKNEGRVSAGAALRVSTRG